MNEKASPKICGATGFRLAVVFVADVYVIRRRVFFPRDYDEGVTEKRRGGGQRRTLAEYLTTLGALGRRGEEEGPAWPAVEVPKVAARRKEAEKGTERDSSRAQRFLRLTFSRLAFYLGQTGIRLNALIKLLTSFGRPGGHRVSAGWVRELALFCPPSSGLPFIFVPPLRTANRTLRSTIGVSCNRRSGLIGRLVKKSARWNLPLFNECFGTDPIATEFRCNYPAHYIEIITHLSIIKLGAIS